MITAIEIENFRGIAKGTVSGLKPLTALVGANNSGKSTILEALYVLACQGHPAAWLEVIKVRGWFGLEAVRAITYRNNGHCLVGEGRPENQRFMLQVQQTLNGMKVDLIKSPTGQLSSLLFEGEKVDPIPYLANPGAIFIDIGSIHQEQGLEGLYSKAIEPGIPAEEHLTALCAVLRPATKQLRIRTVDNRSLLYTMDNDGVCALHFAGDGMRRLFKVACYLAVAKGRVVLIEEPECFQHPIAMDEFTKLIWAAVAQGTQVVFSTHSLELLSLVLAKEDGRDLSKACVVRTKLTDGQLITLNIDGPNASERMAEVGEDLRR